MKQRIGFLVSHPIQYYAPIFRELAKISDLKVYFAHRQNAEQQARAGYGVAFEWDVDLLSGYESEFLTNVARVPSTGSFFGCNSPEIGNRIEAGRFDGFVVPGWSLRSYWQAVRASRRVGVPVMVRGDSQLGGRRSPVVRLAKAVAFRELLRQFDGYLHVGQRNRAYLEHYGAPADRLFFSPHCVDNDTFARTCAAARREVPAVAEEAVRARRVLFVGRLVGDKRPMDLVEAAALLVARGRHIELVVAGAGELESSLRTAAERTGVPTRFMGFVNQSRLPSVYATADVLVLPSTARETWGLVVNEAMACGVPAVVSDAVGCGPDLIEPGRTGAVAPLGDIARLADAVAEVLDFEPEPTRQRLAEIMRVYSPQRAAEGIVEAGAALARRMRLG